MNIKFSAEMKMLVWTEGFSADKKKKRVNENKIFGWNKKRDSTIEVICIFSLLLFRDTININSIITHQ